MVSDSDDFIINRRRKNERFRQLEEERRARLQTTTGEAVVNDSVNAKEKESQEQHDCTVKHPKFLSQQPQRLPPRLTTATTAARTNSSAIKGVSFLENLNTKNSNNNNNDSHHHTTIPNGVGYMNMKSSPSSSVTMSQTPEKRRPPQSHQQQQHYRRRTTTSPTTGKSHNHNHNNATTAKKITTLLDSDDSQNSDAEETIMDVVERLEREEQEQQQNAAAAAAADRQKSTHHHNDTTTITTAAKRKRSVELNTSTHVDDDNNDDNDDEGDDLVALAQQLDARRRRQNGVVKESTTSVSSFHSSRDATESRPNRHINTKQPTAMKRPPRNPITLMMQEKNLFGTTSSSLRNNNNNINNTNNSKSGVARNLFVVKESSKQTNLLWSDSEDDVAFGPRKSRTTTRTKKKATEQVPVVAVSTMNRRFIPTTIIEENDMILAENTEGGNDDDDDDAQHLLPVLKPHFDHPKFGPYDPPVPFVLRQSDTITATSNDDDNDVIDSNDDDCYRVPASINRYIPDYQRAGIEFMYRCGIVTGGGAILGDDMGLGKTVQTISLLTALFRKSGTDRDLVELKRRQKLVESKMEQTQHEKEQALMEGRIYRRNESVDDQDFRMRLKLPEWCPVLIIAPNAVVTNWVEDFKTWAHFSVAVYQGTGRASALERVENGMAEVLVCGDSTIQGVDSFIALDSAKVKWKVIVVDEFHKFKNESKHLATNLRRMRDRHGCVVLGLTGTLMQNNHKELWNLVDIVAKDFLGPWGQFEEEYAKAIQLSRTKDASGEAVELGDQKAVELSTKLQRVYLRRTKEDTLADVLPTKDERIIFCELSSLQKELYKYIIELPDFIVLRHKNAPCDCGVNQKHLRNKEDRIEYQRKNRDKITTRGQCCYKYPKSADGSGVDPNAVIWRQQHPEDQQCSNCPSCTLFSAMSVLYKLCSHAALIQVKTPPDRFAIDSPHHEVALRQLDRAKCFIPPHLLSKVPGGYYLENSIMDNHFALSGKMAVLDKLLQAINAQQGRVLLFAHSTKSLDLIESYILSMGKYSHLRMDGQTTNPKRKEIADKFRASSEIFVLLLSTKAMGLGLNLTEANFVIMFDVDWNPSSDSQAQDRAYRIGQERNVKVFRLVARGTIEEQKYLRQVYKTQLKSETIVDVKNLDRRKSSRLFRGVAGDENRKGELFGSENLLKFKDGTFMNYASRMSESRRYGVGVYDTNDLLETVKDLSEDELDNIGQEGNIFGDIANCVQENDSDCDEDANLGGMSQAVMEVCEQVDDREEKRYQTAPIPDEIEHERESLRLKETQSPLYALCPLPQSTEMEFAETLGDGQHNARVVNGAGLQQTSSLQAPNDVVKKSLIRNTKVAGKTSDQIRRGEVGTTTFKVSDLFIPGASRHR